MFISSTYRCTTTPTVRRRRRTKEELLKAASTLDSGNILLPQPEPSTTSISISAYAGAAPIVVYSHNNVGQDLTGEPVPVPPTLELPAEIVQDLFQSMSEFCLLNWSNSFSSFQSFSISYPPDNTLVQTRLHPSPVLVEHSRHSLHGLLCSYPMYNHTIFAHIDQPFYNWAGKLQNRPIQHP